MKSRILLIEEPESQKLTAEVLRAQGYEVFEAWSPDSARHLLSSVQPHIAIVDLALGKESGAVLLAEVPPRTGAIVLSSDPSQDTRRRCLEAGALDYMLKPINRRDLALKVTNLLAFARFETEPMSAVDLGPLKLDLVTRVLTSSADDRECRLTGSEFALLLIFLKSQGSVLSRRVLTDIMKYSGDATEGRALDVLVCRLRSKLKRIGHSRRLISIHRKGYSLSVEDLAFSAHLFSDLAPPS